MKLTGKIMLATLLSLSILGLASPSAAWRGRGGSYGYGNHYRHYGHRGHPTVKRHYGNRYYVKPGYRHYGHKPHVRHGHRGHRYGIYLGYGHGYYSRYGYGHRLYYHYPYGSRSYYKSHRVNRTYDRGYPDLYRNDFFADYISESDVLFWPAGFVYWPNLAF